MTKNKHDHKASKKLKSLIFGIMLLLPFLFLLPTGIYYALNQTATLSETTIVETNYFNINYQLPSTNNPILEEGNLYMADILCNEEVYLTDFDYLNIMSLDYDTADEIQNSEYQYYFNFDGEIYIGINGIEYAYYGQDEITILFAIGNNWALNPSDITWNRFYPVTFQIPSGENTTTTNTNSVSTSVINAWNDTWSNPLFSWADSSPFNNAINGFTNVFNIQVENHINTMLAYEFSIIAIYVVLDIVIELFICLTHIIPRSD